MRYLLLLLMVTCICSAEKWVQLEDKERASVKDYIQRLINVGESGTLTEYLNLRIGPGFVNASDAEKENMKNKGDEAKLNDIRKLKSALASDTMIWFIKPALVHVKFASIEGDADSVVILGSKPKGWNDWVIMGFNQKWSAPEK